MAVNEQNSLFPYSSKEMPSPQNLSGNREVGDGHHFVYVHTPWQLLIELISYPQGMNFPKKVKLSP